MLNTPQQVIDRARSLWYVSSSQYSDAKSLEDYNIVRRELSNLIMQNVDENYFTETILTLWIVWQNEYALTDDINSIDVNKIQTVWIKYEATWEYVEANLINEDRLNKSLEEYEEQQSTTNPFYFISWDSLHIYPSIKDTNVTEWIKVVASLTPYDLAISDTETLFPREHRHVISLGMLPMIYQRKWLIPEADNAMQKYQIAITEMILDLTDRVSTPQEVKIPDLSYYE